MKLIEINICIIINLIKLFNKLIIIKEIINENISIKIQINNQLFELIIKLIIIIKFRFFINIFNYLNKLLTIILLIKFLRNIISYLI